MTKQELKALIKEVIIESKLNQFKIEPEFKEGDIVSEWIIKGAMITTVNFGDYSWDTLDTAVNISMTIQPDYCVLNF